MSTPILATKLYIPPPKPQLILRPRLTQRLEQSLHAGHKLTLISAPPGFGKTTLVSSWIYDLRLVPTRVLTIDDLSTSAKIENPKSKIQNLNVAWLSLDEGDNDPVRFWSYVMTALDKAQPGVGQEALALLQPPQSPPIETILTTLVNALAAAPAQILLILDDYHLIELEAIHQAMTFLLDHLPLQLHLLLTSRTDPPLPLTRLRVRGQLTELRQTDLRFTLDEAITFFNQVMQLNLTPADILALENRTEGWIAGLQLAALSMQGQTDATSFVQAFTGSHRYVFDYLAEEVLAHQPAHIQTFLLQTSILERLSGELCDAVLSRGAEEQGSRGEQSSVSFVFSQEILEQLERSNLFLISLDSERHWYRYHHLFADFLRAQLRQKLSPAEVADLHLRAGRWHGHNGFIAEAINHTLAAGDAEQATHFIEQVILTLLANGETATVVNWLKALPETLIRCRPRLSLGQAWAKIIVGQWHDVESLVDDAEQVLQASSATNQQSDDPLIRGWWAEIVAIRSMLMSNLGQSAQVIELSRQALERLPENNLLVRSIITHNMGIAYEMMGDLTQANRTLNQAYQMALASDNLMIALITTGSLARIEADQGRLHQAISLYQGELQLVAEKTRTQGRPSNLAQWAYVNLAELLREQNDLTTAKHYLTLAFGLEAVGDPSGNPMAIGQLILARLLQAEGDAEGANQAIQQAMRQISPPSSLVYWLEAVQARLWLAQGRLAEAIRWAESCDLPLDERFNFYQYPGEYAILARVLLAQTRHTEALALLERMQAAAEASGRTGRLVEIYLLQALVCSAQGEMKTALTSLERALVLGEAGGYVRLFADEGMAVAELLVRVRDRGTGGSQAYVDKLLATLPHFSLPILDFGLNPVENSKPQAPELVESLSERELEILRLVAGGLSNQEIAERLVIAEGTVKKHLHNIFGKLAARSRTQALLRANELKLL